tara:strand:+ start:58 stop:333 length:276 start_codon:yes stop_codon:yes gene_type:complete
MKKISILTFLFLINLSTISYSKNNDCKEFKKFSIEYFKCKGEIVKDKTITTGKNIIKDTKDFQNKKWSDEKKKMENAKDKINETKEKVLKQ